MNQKIVKSSSDGSKRNKKEVSGNEVRAIRFDDVMKLHSQQLGMEPEEWKSHLSLASLMADCRHWCDKHGLDFHEAERVSYQHYLDEKQNPNI
jgi:hypothetical protein